jgi:hypothetical protein
VDIESVIELSRILEFETDAGKLEFQRVLLGFARGFLNSLIERAKLICVAYPRNQL